MAITIGVNGWVSLANTKARFAHLRSTLGDANSPMTDTLGEVLITQCFYEMNALLLTQGYTLAALAADATATAVLEGINAVGAAAAIGEAMTGLSAESHGASVASYREQYDRQLDRLRQGYYTFPSAQSTGESTSMVTAELAEDGDYDPDDNRYKSDTVF
jgi:hypothetical protein